MDLARKCFENYTSYILRPPSFGLMLMEKLAYGNRWG
jgi:hypothetical protein